MPLKWTDKKKNYFFNLKPVLLKFSVESRNLALCKKFRPSNSGFKKLQTESAKRSGEMSAIIDNPETYFRQFIPPRSALLKELEEEAYKEDIPIVGPVVGELLFILARIIRAEKILELGTATGYSAIFLSEAFESIKGQLITIENDSTMAQRARKNFQRAGFKNQIEIRVGDAIEVIKTMQASFDLIFMDIDKVDYNRALPHCGRLLRKNGLLVADNIGFEDADPFNASIYTSKAFRPVSLFSFLPFHSPEKDGICLALHL
jgi:caffeoyl-CoA O-methyltransferase